MKKVGKHKKREKNGRAPTRPQGMIELTELDLKQIQGGATSGVVNEKIGPDHVVQ